LASQRESDPIGKLSASIADGASIDWDAIRELAADDQELRKLLEHLQVVAAVADVHRHQVAETLESSRRQDGTTRSADVEPARRWGHLLLIRKIGEGAFGEVYEALDTWLDHPRALKLLKTDTTKRLSPAHILHEARKLVRVRHPNVVMVHGADSHDGRVGFWMDLIQGQTLEEHVRGGRLSAGEATHIGRELCSALAAVHAANLVHRDVKAQNVMRASDGGRIILMDFGAGEFLDVPSDRRPQGTPLYLAPELFTGGAATIQSDIYSLGVLLYYLVTGKFPVQGRTFTDLALAHAQRDRRHLRDERPDLPDPFIKVVERAIDPEPVRRFETSGDLHAALEGQARPAAVTVVEPPAAGPTPKPIVPGRVRFALAAGVAVVALAGWMGLLAYRTFEAALHITSEFRAGPLEYLRLGLEALLPFAIYLAVGSVLLALLPGVWRLLRPMLSPMSRALQTTTRSLSPEISATLVPVLGAAAALALLWWHWPMFATIVALQDAPDVVSTPVILGDGFKSTYLSHSNLSAMLCVVLVLAAWRWWPGVELQSQDVAHVRRMKWVAIGIAVVLATSAVAPRPFVFERFDVVLYQNRPSFVIGTKGDELLLFASDANGILRVKVPRSAVTLKGISKRLVEQP